jgi:chaperone required for assembly of F1-ATPase
MKRFYKAASTAETGDGWQVLLDGRPIKTQGGRAQCVPSKPLAAALCAEWSAQGDELDPATFPLRDMADYAIDVIAPDIPAAAARMLPYGETDTLCYRADPEEALFAKQDEVWEPVLTAFEAREGVSLVRVSGIMHTAQNAQTLNVLQNRLTKLNPFELAALETLTALSASRVIGLSALDSGADIDALWQAANLEEDWQIELWGEDAEASERRAKRTEDFGRAAGFARWVCA